MRRSLVMVALLFMAAPVTGQVTADVKFTFETPSFMGPRPMDDIGIYVTNSDVGTGLQGIWRQSGNLNLGVRAGVGDLDRTGKAVLVGAELYGPINALLAGSGIDISWVLGAGAVFGDNVTAFSVPFGASIGITLGSGNVRISPYVHPRVALDIVAVEIGDEEETDTDGAFAVDIGGDVSLGEKLILRVGGSLGDREAFGVGLALRWPRGVSVVR
jgi:hypothetical protein